jgi:glc operon protein GlcG
MIIYRADMAEMTLAIAERAVSAAQARARELGTPMTVTVVDEAGRLVLCARGDGTGFLTPETSRGKAVAAAAFRRSTKELVELAKEHPAFWNAVPDIAPGQVLPSTGAVPITREGRVIGAIGCGGGTGEQDHQCALAGAAAV